MVSQVHMESAVERANTQMHAKVFAWPMQSSFSEASALAREAGSQSTAGTEDGNCLVGLGVAIGLEAAMALGFYGIWRIWHLIR